MRSVVMVGVALMTAGAGHAQERVVQRGPGAGYPPPGEVIRPPLPPAPIDRARGAARYDPYREPPIAPDRAPPPPLGHHDHDDYAYDAGSDYPPQGPSRWVSPDGRTTVVTTTAGGHVHHYAPAMVGPYGYGAGVTTITIQTAPVVTTTTTETVEDSVTYTRPAARKAYGTKRVWRGKTKRLRR